MQQVTPDAHGVAVLLLIATALFLFTRDRLPLESSSLSILIVLVAGFHFFPYESASVPLGPTQFLSSFGNEALITICALIMVSKGLETTGALQPLAAVVSLVWKTRPSLALLLTLVAVAFLSAFINDTPIAIAAAQQLNVDPTPFVLAVIFGANMSFATPFGYQTNLLILSAGGYRFSDFIKVGIPLMIILWLGYSIALPLIYDLGW